MGKIIYQLLFKNYRGDHFNTTPMSSQERYLVLKQKTHRRFQWQGFDTTGTAICWFLHCMATNPEQQVSANMNAIKQSRTSNLTWPCPAASTARWTGPGIRWERQAVRAARLGRSEILGVLHQRDSPHVPQHTSHNANPDKRHAYR